MACTYTYCRVFFPSSLGSGNLHSFLFCSLIFGEKYLESRGMIWVLRLNLVGEELGFGDECQVGVCPLSFCLIVAAPLFDFVGALCHGKCIHQV